MKIDGSSPQWLLAVIPIVLLLWYMAKKSGNRGNLFERRTMLTLRSMVCILLLLALTGISITTQGKDTATLFLVDSSDSISHALLEIDGFLNQAEENKKPSDAVGIITFGETATLEGRIAHETLLNETRQGYVNKEASDIGNALNLAASLLPEDSRKRIVLISDGVQTQGDMETQAKRLKAIPGLTVDVFPLAVSQHEDVQLTQLQLAKAIRVNADYNISMQIDANADNRVNVKLFKGNALIADQWVDVVKGRNNILFKDRTDKGGNLIYRGEISAQSDAIPQNNKAYAYTNITDVPQLLLIAKEGRGDALQTLLESTAQSVTVALPEGAPTSLSELSRYDGVIVCDVAFNELPKEFPDVLEVYLKTAGGGLFVTGGSNSYALGGYMGTTIEKILPVDMDLKTEGDEPSLGMVMVIDHSGSMSQVEYGVSTMEMAKEAAIRSLDQFKEGDSLGVIAFDSVPTWVVPIQQTSGNQEAMQTEIAKIQPAGGTSILPALQEAYQQLASVSAKQKHILLLTDGQAEQTGYDALIAKMKQNGITLSTIAVGSGADAKLLDRLAQLGNGRFYETNVFSDLPEIFAKETMLAGKEYIQYRPFYPVLQDMPDMLAGISQIPMLHGYIATTAKPRADVVLKTDSEEPVLAFWQYGLGRSGAWTSDVSGMFSADWLNTPEGSKILLNAISYVTKRPAAADITVSATQQGENSLIRIETPFADGYKTLSAEVVSDSGQYVATGAVRAVMPGVYEMTAEASQGAYFLNLTAENSQGQQEVFQTGFAVSFPQEYDQTLSEKGAAALASLAEQTGGRMLTDGGQAFEKEAESVSSPKSLTNIFLWLAALLFLIDVAYRRLPSLRHIVWKMCQILKKKDKKAAPAFKPDSLKKDMATPLPQKPETKKEGDSSQNALSTAELLAKSRKKRNR